MITARPRRRGGRLPADARPRAGALARALAAARTAPRTRRAPPAAGATNLSFGAIGLAKETHHRAALSSRASEHSPRRKLREYDLPSRQQQHLEKSSAGGIVRSTGGIT